MKKNFLVFSCVLLMFNSCEKKKTYTLNFEASHYVSEENMFTSPGAYYSWQVDDENDNPKYDITGSILKENITGTTTAQTGDWIWIYVSVYDVFCNGYVNCTSTDGEISLFASTDNLFIDESDYVTARVSINGKDTIIPVKEHKFQIK